MDDFMRSLSDQQKAMFLAALQDSGTPPEVEVTGDEDDSQWTTTMPPHIREEFEGTTVSTSDFAMKSKNGIKSQKRKIDIKITREIWKSMIRAYIKYEYRNFKNQRFISTLD